MTDKTKWDYVNNKVWADNVEWVEVKSRPFQHGSIGNTNAAKGQKLAEWVTEALNNEAEKRPHKQVVKGAAWGNYLSLMPPSFPDTSLVSKPRRPNFTT